MENLKLLQLLHLADSALPIGGLAHSFGLENLIAEEKLEVAGLPAFLQNYFADAGLLEAVFCRAGHLLAPLPDAEFTEGWRELNQTLSALKPARESRTASLTLGKHFLALAARLMNDVRLQQSGEIHHSVAFGLTGGRLNLDAGSVVSAYLQQSAAGLISACQRLLPYGQNGAMSLLWQIKPTLLEITERSYDFTPATVRNFAPLLELGAIRHARLQPRLFIS